MYLYSSLNIFSNSVLSKPEYSEAVNLSCMFQLLMSFLVNLVESILIFLLVCILNLTLVSQNHVDLPLRASFC